MVITYLFVLNHKLNACEAVWGCQIPTLCIRRPIFYPTIPNSFDGCVCLATASFGFTRSLHLLRRYHFSDVSMFWSAYL